VERPLGERRACSAVSRGVINNAKVAARTRITRALALSRECVRELRRGCEFGRCTRRCGDPSPSGTSARRVLPEASGARAEWRRGQCVKGASSGVTALNPPLIENSPSREHLRHAASRTGFSAGCGVALAIYASRSRTRDNRAARIIRMPERSGGNLSQERELFA